MSLVDWQRHGELVNSARELFDTALWQKMLGVLYNGLPIEYLRRPGATPTDVARALGRVEGYVDCMNLLQSLGIAPAQSVDIPTTWGVPAQGEAINE